MKLNNSVIVITGGASGIGKIMGRIALERGAAHLVVWDINQAGIDATVAEYSKLGKVSGWRVDVSDTASIDAAYAATIAACGDVDILINCAGIVTNNRTFDKQTDSDIIRTMNINATAPMLVALRVLPRMIERDRGHICNIASAAGMLALPKMSIYAASKWATIGWSDSVRLELKEKKSNVKFTTIAPYFINTGMFDGVRSKVFSILDPEKTSKKIMDAIERGKGFRGIPFGFHFIRFSQGILPYCIFDFFYGKIFGIYSVMDHFTGRKA